MLCWARGSWAPHLQSGNLTARHRRPHLPTCTASCALLQRPASQQNSEPCQPSFPGSLRPRARGSWAGSWCRVHTRRWKRKGVWSPTWHEARNGASTPASYRASPPSPTEGLLSTAGTWPSPPSSGRLPHMPPVTAGPRPRAWARGSTWAAPCGRRGREPQLVGTGPDPRPVVSAAARPRVPAASPRAAALGSLSIRGAFGGRWTCTDTNGVCTRSLPAGGAARGMEALPSPMSRPLPALGGGSRGIRPCPVCASPRLFLCTFSAVRVAAQCE